MKQKVISLILCTVILFSVLLSGAPVVSAKENTVKLDALTCLSGEKDQYQLPEDKSVGSEKAIGSVTVTGDMKTQDIVSGFTAFAVADGNVSIRYSFRKSSLATAETQWHIVSDSDKNVGDIALDKKVDSGALIVQTSLDGKTWITDTVLSNIFSDADSVADPIYTSKDIQLENGCYYRIIAAYTMERKTGEKKYGPVTRPVIESKKVTEAFSFYAINKKNIGSTMSPATTPRLELGKLYGTINGKGYKDTRDIDNKDPHFGWKLGTFVVNGFTRKTVAEDQETPVFLKNVGDKVTLWFTLKQDINALNKDSTLSIAEDTKGYDQTYEVKNTNFKHGTLIIQHTNFEGTKSDPIIYTDFLAANARTGADTRVQLFEEGDYEVTLDYSIQNSPRKVKSVNIVPTYTSYKIVLKYQIRNGNCMVFPFDNKTGNELSNNAITENGFHLDFAKSRYLNIDVKRTTLNVSADGIITEDIRFDRPAADSDSYTDEGIYTFSVKNLYTGETIEKTIYVGTSKYLRALSKNGLTVAELNAKIKNKATINEDGSIKAYVTRATTASTTAENKR